MILPPPVDKRLSNPGAVLKKEDVEPPYVVKLIPNRFPKKNYFSFIMSFSAKLVLDSKESLLGTIGVSQISAKPLSNKIIKTF
jgi:hypothetical protein